MDEYVRRSSTRRAGRALLIAALALLLFVSLAAQGCAGGGRENTTDSGVGPGASEAGDEPSAAAGETPGADDADFSFIVCGDPHNNYEVLGKVLEEAQSVDFLIIAGDLTGSGTRTEFQNFVSFMEQSGVEYYAVPGNHDVTMSPADGFFSEYIGPPYQSFSYMNSHFVLIDNSSIDHGFYASQREWVKEELERVGDKGFEHLFAVCHVPPGYPYSLRTAGTRTEGVIANERLVPVLSEGGVDQLFCGHFHAYSEWETGSLTVTVTGGAGAPLHASPGGGGYHHYVLVEIEGSRRTQSVIRI